MTLWKSQERLDGNVDKIRALATSASGMSPTSGKKGSLAVELKLIAQLPNSKVGFGRRF
tara:strand:+ start:290 stop:466 length:177 start_codon:yes stop_codon:yes gene_type:complete